MTPVLVAAIEIQQFCQAREWQFCIIGGLAVLRWGEPRATQDVDITLLTGFGNAWKNSGGERTADPTFRESRREFQADFAGRPAAA